MSTAVDPRLVDNVVQWADYMYPTIEQYGVAVQLNDERDWKDWASGLQALSGLAQVGVPSPYMFDDWREWAMRFNEMINQGS